MSLYIGNQKLGSLYLGSTKIKEAWVGDVKVYGPSDPYNPLNLPPFTFRCKFAQGYTPQSTQYVTWESRTLVDPVENIWDLCFGGSGGWNLFYGNDYLLEIIGGNTSDVLVMSQWFYWCQNLRRISLFDTSKTVNMLNMFVYCHTLEEIPPFDMSSCTNAWNIFRACSSVKSGALESYRRLSTNGLEVTHYDAFLECGINTTTGLAELQQIPQSWGGLAPG
jgi:hypothetical protein